MFRFLAGCFGCCFFARRHRSSTQARLTPFQFVPRHDPPSIIALQLTQHCRRPDVFVYFLSFGWRLALALWQRWCVFMCNFSSISAVYAYLFQGSTLYIIELCSISSLLFLSLSILFWRLGLIVKDWWGYTAHITAASLCLCIAKEKTDTVTTVRCSLWCLLEFFVFPWFDGGAQPTQHI